MLYKINFKFFQYKHFLNTNSLNFSRSRSSAWSEHLAFNQGVVGSNPSGAIFILIIANYHNYPFKLKRFTNDMGNNPSGLEEDLEATHQIIMESGFYILESHGRKPGGPKTEFIKEREGNTPKLRIMLSKDSVGRWISVTSVHYLERYFFSIDRPLSEEEIRTHVKGYMEAANQGVEYNPE